MSTQTASSAAPQEGAPQPARTMRAATITEYGGPTVITIGEVERATCGPGEVLVSVRACSLNPVDWHDMTGTPLLKRMDGGWTTPTSARLGTDLAGVVEAVGEEVTRFQVGDEVFGTAAGAFAEVVACDPHTLARKPDHVSFEDAAAVPVAALTALQGLRDHGSLTEGQRVLVNGASGGVGTYAVQLAKHFGAEVTGVCSTRNVDLVRGLGADHVVDYTTHDFTQNRDAYDVVLDNVGNRAASDYKRCMTRSGTCVIITGPKGRVFGPVWHFLKAVLSFRFSRQRAAIFFAKPNAADMEVLSDLLRAGVIRTVVDEVYSLDQLADGFRTLETGRTRGKLVVTV